ncbi:unnamed protein product [Paramecium primaurelia]|uniref:Uncharacterized protein n=1 Tax=Paramecium primaurelia TaxID=5886 RepID=A0A8S1PMD5_PARPR|nr:unnamed protein product [Paramecium primaurelia]
MVNIKMGKKLANGIFISIMEQIKRCKIIINYIIVLVAMVHMIKLVLGYGLRQRIILNMQNLDRNAWQYKGSKKNTKKLIRRSE